MKVVKKPWRNPQLMNMSTLLQKQLFPTLEQHLDTLGEIYSDTILFKFFTRNPVDDKRLNHKYIITELKELHLNIEPNSQIYWATIREYYRNRTHREDNRLVFCKKLPIIPVSMYHLTQHTHDHRLTTVGMVDLHTNIYSLENSTFMEIFASYLLSNLVENRDSPHFPLFYGTFSSIVKTYQFRRDTIEDIVLPDSVQLEKDDDGDYEISLPEYPTQFLFQEKLSGMISDVLDRECYFGERWKAYVFQIIAALAIAQSRYQMYHNDLHLENIMYKPTRQKYLYYQLNDKQYFKVPTFGKILKIIDWGRSTFLFQDKRLHNQCFYRDQDVFGQYIYENKAFDFSNTPRYKQVPFNSSADMGMVIYNLYCITRDKVPRHSRCEFYQWLQNQCLNIKGINKYSACKKLNFTLYKELVRHEKNKQPNYLLQDDIFKNYLLETKEDLKEMIYPLK